jgi:hypothetical protein
VLRTLADKDVRDPNKIRDLTHHCNFVTVLSQPPSQVLLKNSSSLFPYPVHRCTALSDFS